MYEWRRQIRTAKALIRQTRRTVFVSFEFSLQIGGAYVGSTPEPHHFLTVFAAPLFGAPKALMRLILAHGENVKIYVFDVLVNAAVYNCVVYRSELFYKLKTLLGRIKYF